MKKLKNDMQQAKLEGEHSIDDAENQLMNDLSMKLKSVKKQLFEAIYYLENKRCYISADAKISIASKLLNEVKEVVSANCK